MIPNNFKIYISGNMYKANSFTLYYLNIIRGFYWYIIKTTMNFNCSFKLFDEISIDS